MISELEKLIAQVRIERPTDALDSFLLNVDHLLGLIHSELKANNVSNTQHLVGLLLRDLLDSPARLSSPLGQRLLDFAIQLNEVLKSTGSTLEYCR